MTSPLNEPPKTFAEHVLRVVFGLIVIALVVGVPLVVAMIGGAQ